MLNIKKSRKAFTMIELIFVIVIIGILAITALPKLVATRTDAKLSVMAHNTMVAASEIASYATSKGTTTAVFKDMSNAIKNMVNNHEAVDTGNYRVTIKVDNAIDCVILKIDNHGTDIETLVIEDGSSTNDDCDQFRTLIDKNSFPMVLHGQQVKY